MSKTMALKPPVPYTPTQKKLRVTSAQDAVEHLRQLQAVSHPVKTRSCSGITSLSSLSAAKATSPPHGARRQTPAAATKQSSHPKTSSYNSTTNMQKATDKRSTPTVGSRGSPTSIATAKQSAPVRRAPLQPAAAPSNVDLVECRVCHRRFASDRIAKHESICNRTSRKKRKEYDATKHRVAGTEAEAYVRRASRSGAQQPQKETYEKEEWYKMREDFMTTVQRAKSPGRGSLNPIHPYFDTSDFFRVPSKKDDWRKKHEDFIATIRAAKQAQAHVKAGGNLRDLPPPPPLDTSDYIQCPHCMRKFNEAAAERHIPRCATMIHNKPKPVAANAPRGAAAVKRR